MQRAHLMMILLLLIGSPLLLADVVYEMEVKEATGQSNRNTIEVGGGNLRMDINQEGSKGSMIFRGDRPAVLILDHESKTWFELDQKAMQQLGDSMNAAMKQMEEALKNVPESQREMVERMMKERMGDQMPQQAERVELDFTAVGSGSVAGYSCRTFDVMRKEERIRQLCVTEWGSIEGGAEAAAVMQDMSEFLTEMMDTLAAGPFSGMMQVNRGVFEDLKKVGGMPIASVDYDEAGEVERETTLVSATPRSVSQDRFEPPAGYSRQSMGPGN